MLSSHATQAPGEAAQLNAELLEAAVRDDTWAVRAALNSGADIESRNKVRCACERSRRPAVERRGR